MNKKNGIIIGVSIVIILAVIGVVSFLFLKPKKISISVYDNVTGGHKIVDVDSDSRIKDLMPEIKDGYKFVSWVDSNGDTISDSSVLNPNDKVYAVYEPLKVGYVFQLLVGIERKHEVVVSDKKVLSVSEKGIDNLYGGAGAMYEFSVYGLSAGEASVTVNVLKKDGTKESSTTYYFYVDNNLDINFEKMVEEKNESETDSPTTTPVDGPTTTPVSPTDSPTTTPVTPSTPSGIRYTFEKGVIFSQSHRVVIANNDIVAVTETPQSSQWATGGLVYQFTVQGLKAGKTNVTLEILNESGIVEASTTYYFYVDNNLNVNLEKEVENTVSPATTPTDSPSTTSPTTPTETPTTTPTTQQGVSYVFEKGHPAVQTHKTYISNKKIVSVSEKGLDSQWAMGGINYQFTVKGLKAGKANVTLDINNDDGTTYSRTVYHFTVDSNLNVTLDSEETQEFPANSIAMPPK